MLQAYTITTLNINRITSELKMAALKQYIYESGTDIALLQEVTVPQITMPGFLAVTNFSPETSVGTAILYREGIPVTQIEKLDSGRGISVRIFDVTVINLYAPSGSSNRAERNKFFKEHIIYLLRQNPSQLILGGDFNCVLSRKDQAPNFNFSSELKCLVSDLKLKDAWEVKYPTLVRFTHIVRDSCSRIDRIYISENLKDNLVKVETIPTSFSDHSGVLACVNLNPQPTRWFKNQWNLNVSVLTDSDLGDAVRSAWEQCLRTSTTYQSTIEWWIRKAKPKLRAVLKSFSIERAAEIKRTMEFYYAVLRDLYDRADATATRIEDIKRIKAKLISIKRMQLEGLKIKSKVKSVGEDETAALYHLIKHARNRRRTFIDELKLENGTVLKNQRDIVREVYQYYEDTYNSSDVHVGDYGQLFNNISTHVTPDDNEIISSPLSNEDIFEIICSSPLKKSPGPDGLPIEFYKHFWPVIGDKITQVVNEVLQGLSVPREFKECKIVLIPKTRGSKNITSLRPISLLNSDYKIVARAVKMKIMPLTDRIIGLQQTCAFRRTILHTVALYRDIIGLTDASSTKCGLLFLDFFKAFDRVSHEYLLETMKRMGFLSNTIAIVKNLAMGISAKISVNSQLTKQIQINRGVPQGSPLSMLLFVISLEPLLATLQAKLTGITISGVKTAVGAYADDVGVIIRNADDIVTLETELRKYCSASGAQINERKSKFLNLRGLDHLRIPYATAVDEHKALGTVLTASSLKMTAVNWREVSRKINGALIDNYQRSLNQFDRIRLINSCVLSKAYYMAQILPIPKVIAASIMSKITNFIWKGEIFRVSVKTATLHPKNGGMGLVNIRCKATALYVKRTHDIIQKEPTSITAQLFDAVKPSSLEPPLNVQTISYRLKYIRDYYLERSYLSEKLLKSKILTAKAILGEWIEHEGKNPVEEKFRGIHWDTVWKNVSCSVLSSDARTALYKAINDIISTNERLHKIGLSDTDLCRDCNLVDTVQHRYICGDRIHNWRWLSDKIAFLLRTSPANISTSLLCKPDKQYYPTKKNNAVMWLIGNYSNYVVNNIGRDNSLDFMSYMDTEFSKTNKYVNHEKRFGNMLKIIFKRMGIG